jgi:recombination protein RecT
MSQQEQGLVKANAGLVATVLQAKVAESFKARFNGDKEYKDAFYSALVNIAKTNDAIAKCDITSVLVAAANCAQLGLLPIVGLDHAYIVPYGSDATLIIGYKGYIELARRSGRIKAVNVEIIYEHDDFNFTAGLNPILTHIPFWLRKPAKEEAGAIKGAYVVVEFDNGSHQCDVFSYAELLKSKEASKSAKSPYSPWQKWEIEMLKKTAIRKASKRWPLSIMMAKAEQLDTDADLGRKQEADISDIIPEASMPLTGKANKPAPEEPKEKKELGFDE